MCVCVCVRACVCASLHGCVHPCVPACVRASLRACVRTYVHACVHVCVIQVEDRKYLCHDRELHTQLKMILSWTVWLPEASPMCAESLSVTATYNVAIDSRSQTDPGTMHATFCKKSRNAFRSLRYLCCLVVATDSEAISLYCSQWGSVQRCTPYRACLSVNLSSLLIHCHRLLGTFWKCARIGEWDGTQSSAVPVGFSKSWTWIHQSCYIWYPVTALYS